MTTRQQAISWWENLQAKKQQSFMVGDLKDRALQSLTGIEIENIYNAYIKDIRKNMNIIYSIPNKALLIIPMYYFNGSSSLNVLIEQSNQIKDLFAYLVPDAKIENIYSKEITKSTRYKNNWEFWLRCECPNGIEKSLGTIDEIIN